MTIETEARACARPPRSRTGSRWRAAAAAALIAGTAAGVLAGQEPAAAAPYAAGGYTTDAAAAAGSVAPGTSVTLSATVTAPTNTTVVVDLEVYSSSGRVLQRYWENQQVVAGRPLTLTTTWAVPANARLEVHTLKVGVFGAGWSGLLHWNDRAATVTVATGASAPATTLPPATSAPTTTAPATTSPTTPTTVAAPVTTVSAPAGGGARFVTLAPGAALPSDAECAGRVRRGTGELRPANAGFNATRGVQVPSSAGPIYGRVTGNFTGTTDELIQWASCKWGFDEDVVRAQVAKESSWYQRATGDWTSTASRCVPGHPIGADGRPGQCPESIGLLQIRYPYWAQAFPAAVTSSAFNLDYALAARRSCFEGRDTWLNMVERGRTYAAGDLWGCIGMWFSGRWYTPASVTYIDQVKDYLARRIWASAEFRNW